MADNEKIQFEGISGPRTREGLDLKAEKAVREAYRPMDKIAVDPEKAPGTGPNAPKMTERQHTVRQLAEFMADPKAREVIADMFYNLSKKQESSPSSLPAVEAPEGWKVTSVTKAGPSSAVVVLERDSGLGAVLGRMYPAGGVAVER